jgi:hypothetical protein
MSTTVRQSSRILLGRPLSPADAHALLTRLTDSADAGRTERLRALTR